MDGTQTSFAQRSQDRLYFDHRDMDYYLSWIMGREIYQGSDAAECMEAASRITNGDAASWQREWRRLAEQVEKEAQLALQRGDREAARGGFLRACTYHRAPLFVMTPHDPTFRSGWQRMHACFMEAAALFDPPIESIRVPFGGMQLQGYAWQADRSGQPRPTLIISGGIETFAEDCYFMVGHSGVERGFNLITVDLPGQGLTPEQGLYFNARMEEPVGAVLDYALSRPDTDAERLAIFGFSWGGHIVFKGARHDRRIKAMIANPAMPDVFRAVLAQQKGHNRKDPISKIVFQQIVWRMGVRISFNPRDIARRMVLAYDYFVHGKVRPGEIPCPALCLAGEGEAPVTLQIARECFEQLPHPMKQLRIFTRAEGGEAHCQVNNLSLPNGVMFDWLEKVFAGQ